MNVVNYAQPDGYPTWHYQSEVEAAVHQTRAEMEYIFDELPAAGWRLTRSRMSWAAYWLRLSEAPQRGGVLNNPLAAQQLEDRKNEPESEHVE
jgi:hypothetical protein